MDKLLMRNLNKENYQDDNEKNFDNIKVYKVLGEENTLYYWNSSNSQPIYNHKRVLIDIMDSLLDEEEEGTVSDGFNEIMFELEYS